MHRALSRQPVQRVPMWLMRQAGRYLPEYNATRKKAGSFLDLCKNPELACEVTLQPIERFNLDAAILFSDILTIPDALGLELYFVEGEGPKFRKEIKSESDIEAIPLIDVTEKLDYVAAAVKTIRQSLNTDIPLIGFSGSPWTLSCYSLSGGSSRDDFLRARKWLYSRPEMFKLLLDKLTIIVCDYCEMQISSGANVIMLFDSWGGLLPGHNLSDFSLKYLRRIIRHLKTAHDIKIITFVKGAGQHLNLIADLNCDAIGIDWMTSLRSAKDEIGHRCALQGNLDPAVLLGTQTHIEAEVKKLFSLFGNRAKGIGHIFNLGHGISQFTPPDNVSHLVEMVKKYSQQDS